MNVVAGCCDYKSYSDVTSLNPQDSSSVIQFVTRGSVQVNDRTVEVPKGLPEDISVSISSVNASTNTDNTTNTNYSIQRMTVCNYRASCGRFYYVKYT